LTSDIEAAGCFLNKANLAKLAETGSGWSAIQSDVEAIEQVLGVELGPKTEDETKHQALSAKLLQTTDANEMAKYITEMAVIRKSLG
jgi:phosphoenolpyruvate carboxylase